MTGGQHYSSLLSGAESLSLFTFYHQATLRRPRRTFADPTTWWVYIKKYVQRMTDIVADTSKNQYSPEPHPPMSDSSERQQTHEFIVQSGRRRSRRQWRQHCKRNHQLVFILSPDGQLQMEWGICDIYESATPTHI